MKKNLSKNRNNGGPSSVREMIRLKNKDEIKRIKDSGRILAGMYGEIRSMIVPGISTYELDKFARDFVEKRGAKPAFLGYMDYPASLCTSVNEEVIHGIPGKRKLREGDIVSLDFGVDLKGYISDSAFTMAVGNISLEAENLMNLTREALYAAIEQARAGNRIQDISAAVYGKAEEKGYGVVREFCGHGVGFEVHEPPQIPNYVARGRNPRLRPGMVLAIEPMINAGTGDILILDDEWTVITADRKLSAHFEHTVAVHEDCTEILTGGGD